MKFVIHIGATKTGSTAFQNLLNDNREHLAEHGVYYPADGVVSGAQHVLFAAAHPTAWNLHKDHLTSERGERHDYFNRTVDKIREDASRAGHHTIVLSSEYLWGEQRPHLYARISQALAGADVELACAIRRPDFWIEATYIQRLKFGEKRPFKEWYEFASQRPEQGFDFFRCIKLWERRLPATKVNVVVYEFDDPEDYMARMCLATTGVELVHLLNRKPSRMRNPSLNAEGAAKILRLNQGLIETDDIVQDRNSILSEYRREYQSNQLYFFDDEMHQHIVEENKPRMSAILRRYFPSGRKQLFREPNPFAVPHKNKIMQNTLAALNPFSKVSRST
jgi:capsular polysaccharide export protein